MKIYIGIDPGKTGAWAAMDDKGLFLNAEHFTNYKDFEESVKSVGKNFMVVLEQVSAMPGQGVTSMFTFGQNYGGWIATLELLKLPYQLVRPQAWQKAILGSFPKGESKARALDYASRLHPNLALKKKDSGIADAICMAHYGRRFL